MQFAMSLLQEDVGKKPSAPEGGGWDRNLACSKSLSGGKCSAVSSQKLLPQFSRAGMIGTFGR